MAKEWAAHMGRRLSGLFGPEFDLHLTSTVAREPVRIGELEPSSAEKAALSVLQRVGPAPVVRRVLDQLAADSLNATPQTQLYNLTGQAAANIPMHVTRAGLPIGAQLAAGFGQDALLLQVAAQVEQAQPWDGLLPTSA